ncbi:MAG TPA: hypothetical protein VN226_04865 [Anaerolineales bacterium]|nr:hypothetical protein [Anaerolineales bacterium]
MKKLQTIVIGAVLSAILLVSCSAPAAETQPAEAPSVVEPGSASTGQEFFSTDYEDAANTRNQLAYGTILLTGSNLPVTQEQAKAMLPLWQAILSLSGDPDSASEEISAVQAQIISNFTPEQLTFITDARITNAMLFEYYASLGIEVPTPSADTTRVPGQGQNMTDEEKAAKRATAEASGMVPGAGGGSGQVSRDLLIRKAIEVLTQLAGG